MATFRKVGADYDAGLRAPHYTNGRLLTAEDLQRDQQATLDRLALLGTGVGVGGVPDQRQIPGEPHQGRRVNPGFGTDLQIQAPELLLDLGHPF